jgi:hypothetical protein
MSDVCFIELGNGRKAVIDASDFDLVRSYNWYYIDVSKKYKHGTGYVGASVTMERGKTEIVFLHRFIAGATKGQVVAFDDKDGLNCTRRNLKIKTRAEINRGTRLRNDSRTGVRNVQIDTERGGFVAAVRHNGVRHRMRFDSIEAADQWARAKRMELIGAQA